MGQAATIALYHKLFLGCLVLFIAMAVLVVVLFFVLDIRETIGYLTGRAARHRIQEMEAESAAKGKLEPPQAWKTGSGGREQRKTRVEEAENLQSAAPGARKVEHAVESAKSSELTETLDNPEELGRTSLLVDDSDAETMLLKEGVAQESLISNGADRGNRVFEMEREIVLLHTDEVME